MVAKLGVLGELNAEKLLGKTGGLILRIITINPKGENIAAIPALTNGSTNYKDFKVIFNGGIESKSSIKTFKWLSEADMSEIETKSTKEVIKDIKSAFDTDVKTTVSDVNKSIQDQKQRIQDTRQNLKDSADELKNLFKSLKRAGVNQGVNGTGVNNKGVNQGANGVSNDANDTGSSSSVPANTQTQTPASTSVPASASPNEAGATEE
jgi:hypothetical protein